MAERTSYITETVLQSPVEGRAERVRDGGHDVPGVRIRARYERLWSLIREASLIADHVRFHDNSMAASPLRPVAELERGVVIGTPEWPRWTPAALLT